MAEIVSTITTVFTQMLGALGQGIVDTAQMLFLTTDGKLTTVAIVVLSFGGISIAFAVTKWVLGLVNLK